MKLPDFTALGTPPTESSNDSIARVSDPAAEDTALEGLGQTTATAGNNLKDIIDVADVNNTYANVYAPKAAALAANFYSQTGNAAVQARPEFEQAMVNLRQETVGQLDGAAATNLEKMIQPHEEKEMYSAGMHAGQQAIVYANQAHNSMMANSASDYSNTVLDDPKYASDVVTNMKAQNTLHLQQMGSSKDTIDEQNRNIDENMELVHQKAIQTRLSSLPGPQQQALLRPLLQTQNDGLPRDLGADYVKPYTPQQMQDIQTKVAAPSPYDDLFQKFGQQYGIDPQELKLHAVVESGLNAQADNGKSVGLMQLQNGNLEKLGVTDPFDAAQSIEGAAKLMAQNKAAGGTDPHTQDLMYYGGTNPAQQGKNTQQYAENLSAVRNSMAGASSGAGSASGASTPANVPAWLAGVAPSTLSKLSEMADATTSREARILSDKNSAEVQQTQQNFVQKWANNSLSATDIMGSNLPAIGEGSKKFWLDQIAKGEDKVNPNDPQVIKQRGILENMKVTDPQGFIGTDMSQYAGKIPAADINKLQTDQANMKKGDTSIEAQNKQASAVVQSVNDMLPVAWKTPKTDADEQSASAFKGNLITAVNDAQKAGGAPMGRDNVRKIASDMLANVSVKNSWWRPDSTVPAYQVPAGTSPLNVYRNSPDNIYIPESFREGLTRAWQNKTGRMPQETDVRAAYLKSVQ